MKLSFETKFFQKKNSNAKTISKYLNNALGDIKIARENKNLAVIFKFTYDSLIKLGIAVIASCGYRVRSRKGHHIKILEKLSEVLDDEKIKIVGDAMRKKRNVDLYGEGIILSKKEVKDYFDFVKGIFKKTEKYLKNQDSLF
jgi:hypothetical protein